MYRDIAMDELLHAHFETIATVHWRAHMATLADFWEGVLFGEEHDHSDAVIEEHRWLREELPLTEDMFKRWLEILGSTLDSRWTGPNVERIRRRGYGLTWAMAHRLTGIRLANLPGRITGLDHRHGTRQEYLKAAAHRRS